MNEEDERLCLMFNPFEGDRDSGARLLSDKMVTRRKLGGPCMVCLGPVLPGERARARREIFEGKAKTFLFCSQCCGAMALSWRDAGAAITARTSYGVKASAAERVA